MSYPDKQPTPPPKFDPELYKKALGDYAKYLKITWEAAVELAEQGIAKTRDDDDIEAEDKRRSLVYDLATNFFDKMCLDQGHLQLIRIQPQE